MDQINNIDHPHVSGIELSSMTPCKMEYCQKSQNINAEVDKAKVIEQVSHLSTFYNIGFQCAEAFSVLYLKPSKKITRIGIKERNFKNKEITAN